MTNGEFNTNTPSAAATSTNPWRFFAINLAIYVGYLILIVLVMSGAAGLGILIGYLLHTLVLLIIAFGRKGTKAFGPTLLTALVMPVIGFGGCTLVYSLGIVRFRL